MRCWRAAPPTSAFPRAEEIAAFRAAQEAAGASYAVFQSPWRDADPASHPDAPYAIRMKAPQTGETIIDDRCRAASPSERHAG